MPIVVLGGGFAGFWAAVAAKRVGGEATDVTLVSREPILQIRPRLYEPDPATFAVDLLPLLDVAGITFLEGEAESLDARFGTVHLASGSALPYDRLVVATGSRMQRPAVPGADDAYSIDTVPEATRLDARLAQIARGTPQPSVLIVGGGYTGIELALSLRDRFERLGGTEVAEALRICLLDRSEQVAASFGAAARAEIDRALGAARVDPWLGQSIAALSATTATLPDGRMIVADAVVLTTGLAAASFASQIPGSKDSLGRVVVDKFLRAPDTSNIFVAGDAADADAGDGNRVLQSCQHAIELGRYAGENAARDLLGLPLIPYSQPDYVTCLDLGRSGAVFTRGWNRTLVATGGEAKKTKRWINEVAIYPPAKPTRIELLDASRPRLANWPARSAV